MTTLNHVSTPTITNGRCHQDEISIFARRYTENVRQKHQRLASHLDPRKFSDHDHFCDHLKSLESITGHHSFLDEKLGGRGQAYRDGQKRHPLARAVGYRGLFDFIRQHPRGGLNPQALVNDVLGGSGTLAGASNMLLPYYEQPYFVTSDPNPSQVLEALNRGFPAVPQAAQATLLLSGAIDHAILAYGTHHIPRPDRPSAVAEVFRYLKPGGQIILQDFEEESPTARWYSEAIDQFSITGHKCDHFSTSEMRELLDDAGFTDVKVVLQYDAFIFEGSNPLIVRGQLLEHLMHMFGLVKLARRVDESEADYHDRLDETLSPFATFSSSEVDFEPTAVPKFTLSQVKPGLWRAEFPRVALVAIGTKPL